MPSARQSSQSKPPCDICAGIEETLPSDLPAQCVDPAAVDDASDAAVAEQRRDPARAAALIMLRRRLALAQIQTADLSGVVVLEVPNAGWAEPFSGAWEDLTGAARPSRSVEEALSRPVWVIVDDADMDRKYQIERVNERVVAALRREHPIVGISHAPDRLLPRDLVRAADLRLVVGPLDSDILGDVAEVLTGERPSAHSEVTAYTTATPMTLRLARRREQTADDYIQRVARLAMMDARPASLPDRGLEHLPGMPEAVAWGYDLARDLAAYTAGKLLWADIDRGCLLVGPPGTGKTTFARALASTCRVPLIAASYARWQSSRDGHLGDLLKAMAKSFDDARQAAPSILFIDELDSFTSRTADTRHRDWWTSVINGLLEHLDGLERREGVVVVGATNLIELVDPAIIRSGRLDRVIAIPLPDQSALAEILRVHLGADLAGVDLSAAALHALGGTGADCERWVRGARRRARNAGRPMMLDDLVEEVRGSAAQLSEDDRRICAVHEAGHALLLALEEPGALQLASIRMSRDEGGRVISQRAASAVTEARLNAELRQRLAGRAAEEVALGRVTGGAGGPADSDLAKATRLAMTAETTLGFSDRPLLWRGAWSDKDMSALLFNRADLAQRVEKRLEAAYASACDVIRRHRHILDAITSQLLEKEVLTGTEVESLVAATQACRWRGRRRLWRSTSIERQAPVGR